MPVASLNMIVAVLALLGFTNVFSGLVLTPLLISIADDFALTVGAAGLVVAAYGAPGVLVALIAGPYSDRYGRKRFLVAGASLVGAATIASAFAPTFEALVALRALTGVGAALVAPNVQAVLADNFDYRSRGRAIGLVVGVQNVAAIIGIPLAGIVGAAISWRAPLVILGTLAAVTVAVLASRLPPSRPAPTVGARELYLTALRHRSTMALLAVGFLSVLANQIWASYVVVFFQTVFGMPQALAATLALTSGVGIFIGGVAGGRAGDRFGHLRVFAVTLVALAVVAPALTGLPLSLGAAVVLNLVFGMVLGARLTTYVALVGNQLPGARGTVISLMTMHNTASLTIGVTIGGALIDASGFGLLGMFCAVATLIGLPILLRFVRETEERKPVPVATA